MFSDFNLDEKIGALPPLSLEDFQIKKKNRKKRCFPILKSSTMTAGSAPETATSHSATYAISTNATSSTQPVAWMATTLVPHSVRDGQTLQKHTDGSETAVSEDLVGSQKRKARRNSIRRLDTDRPGQSVLEQVAEVVCVSRVVDFGTNVQWHNWYL
ncbi:hypothetical protein PR048_030571 [Dryococelus australis]|uniref:Uncharacterized protein n=1 Tax=Dryococelus australis TaxID=614101 RepID=A0ABQ9G9C0_9NEOP|nr:hypothetical protein PR048_030571 [Dryococelus australis]